MTGIAFSLWGYLLWCLCHYCKIYHYSESAAVGRETNTTLVGVYMTNWGQVCQCYNNKTVPNAVMKFYRIVAEIQMKCTFEDGCCPASDYWVLAALCGGGYSWGKTPTCWAASQFAWSYNMTISSYTIMLMCNRLIFSLLRFKETRCSTNYQETIMKVVWVFWQVFICLLIYGPISTWWCNKGTR